MSAILTIPLLTPTIFFNLILGMIGALQTFEGAFLDCQRGQSYLVLGMHIW